MKGSAIDMTRGDPLRILVRFSLPVLAGNILHQVYSITDSVIVGRYLGETALAAVGCTMPVIMLLAALLIGVNTGVGIILSQAYGEKNMPDMRRAFANSLYFGVALSVFIAVVGLLVAEPVLRLMGTPDGPLEQASAYLRINFLTTVCPVFYYLFSSAFRGMGDSRTSLYCLIVSVLGNVGLDILFVAVFRWGVAGSAWATALAQAVSVAFAACALARKYPQMLPQKGDLRFDGGMIIRITRLALPITLQAAFNNLGNIVAQSAVNCFGQSTMAAYTAASRIGLLSLMPVETVGNSLAMYAGQNYGARQMGRVHSGVNASLKIVFVLSVPLGLLMAFGGRPMISLFLTAPSEQVVEIARRYLLITAVPGVLAGVMQVYQQVLRGVGMPATAMWGGLCQLGAKIAIAALGACGLATLDVVWSA